MGWEEVMCVDASEVSSLKEGEIYSITAMQKCICGCGSTVLDVGIVSPNPKSICLVSRRIIENETTVWWFRASRFAPIDTDISELTEVLTQPIFK
jgi:hypothetical protein